MMPVVRISDETDKDLQQLAIPLKDSYDSLIRRLVDDALAGRPYQMPVKSSMTAAPQVSAPVAPQAATPVIAPWSVPTKPNLTHTKLLQAEFGGTKLAKANWNTLAKFAHETAFQKLGSFDALRLATRAQLKEGRYEEEGFVFLPNINISLQGMDSNMCWDNCVRLAHAIGVSVKVIFEWRNNPNAEKPGVQESLSFPD